MKSRDHRSPQPSRRRPLLLRCLHAVRYVGWHLGLVRYPEPALVNVEYSKPYRLAGSSNVWVLCLSGTAWLTRDGCPTDTILSQGDAQRVSQADGGLVVGMPRCRLRIVADHGQLIEPVEALVPRAQR